MAFTDKFYKEIAALTGLKVSDLKKAAADENPVEIKVPELKVYTDEEITEIEEGAVTRAKKSILKEGEAQGKELATKAIKNKLGVTSDSKDLDEVLTAAAELVKTDDATKKRLTLLESDLNATKAEKEALEKKYKAAERERDLVTMLPRNINDAIDTDLHLAKINKHIEQKDDGVYLDGELLLNDKRKPLGMKEAIEAFYALPKNKGLIKTDGDAAHDDRSGRGGEDSSSGGGGGSTGNYKNVGEWRKAWKTRNPDGSLFSEEAQAELESYLEKNPTLSMTDAGE